MGVLNDIVQVSIIFPATYDVQFSVSARSSRFVNRTASDDKLISRFLTDIYVYQRLAPCKACSQLHLCCDDDIPCEPCTAAGRRQCLTQGVLVDRRYYIDGTTLTPIIWPRPPCQIPQAPVQIRASPYIVANHRLGSRADVLFSRFEIRSINFGDPSNRGLWCLVANSDVRVPVPAGRILVQEGGHGSPISVGFPNPNPIERNHRLNSITEHADLRWIIQVALNHFDFSCYELFFFFFRTHLKWQKVALWLDYWNWKQAKVAAFINWTRLRRGGEAILPNSVGHHYRVAELNLP